MPSNPKVQDTARLNPDSEATSDEVTLLDRVKQKKQKLTREYNAKLRELNRVERLLEETNAESVVQEAIELIVS